MILGFGRVLGEKRGESIKVGKITCASQGKRIESILS
jgi:hypothetical protein